MIITPFYYDSDLLTFVSVILLFVLYYKLLQITFGNKWSMNKKCSQNFVSFDETLLWQDIKRLFLKCKSAGGQAVTSMMLLLRKVFRIMSLGYSELAFLLSTKRVSIVAQQAELLFLMVPFYIGVPVGVLAVLLLIQLLANVPEKAMDNEQAKHLGSCFPCGRLRWSSWLLVLTCLTWLWWPEVRGLLLSLPLSVSLCLSNK